MSSLETLLERAENKLQSARAWVDHALEDPQKKLEENMAGSIVAPLVGLAREYLHDRGFRDIVHAGVVLGGVGFFVWPYLDQLIVSHAAAQAAAAEAHQIASRILFVCASPEASAAADWVMKTDQHQVSVVAHDLVRMGESVQTGFSVFQTIGDTVYQHLPGADSFKRVYDAVTIVAQGEPCKAVLELSP